MNVHTASRANPPAEALAATPRDIAGWTLRTGDTVTDHRTLSARGVITGPAEPIYWRPDHGPEREIPCVTVQWEGEATPHTPAADTVRMIAPGPLSRAAAAHARRAGLT